MQKDIFKNWFWVLGFRQDAACPKKQTLKWILSSREYWYCCNKACLRDSLDVKIKRALANSEIKKHAQGLRMNCISAKLKISIWDRAAKFQCVICAVEEDTRYASLQFLIRYFYRHKKWRYFPWLKWILNLSQDPLGYLGYSPRNVKMKNWNGRVERTGRKNYWKTHERGGGKRQLVHLTICM